MTFYLARVLQALGLAYLPTAVLFGTTKEHGMGDEYLWFIIGVVVFSLGRYLEGKATA